MPNLTQVNDWFRAAAEVEAKTPITVGGTTAPEGSLSEQGGMNWGGLAFAKLVEFRRRQSRLSPEELASQANVALNDVLSIERGEGSGPDPRTVHQIALVLKLPERRLLELAGLVETKDQRLRKATVQFTARAESLEELRPEELEALEEYVKVLAEV
jgi:transcriptional regulator with XRE-family HTH domain